MALGSGGARGLAHIGVLKVLIKNHIPIDFIAGSSIGAFIGAWYAKCLNIKEMETSSIGNNRWKLTTLISDLTFKGGLIQGKRLESFIRERLDDYQFADLKIPFWALATNFHTGKAKIFKEGDVANIVRASMSIPFMFKSVKIDNCYYVDAGLSQPVPVAAARSMGADLVIGVNLDSRYLLSKDYRKPSLLTTGRQAMSILRFNLSNHSVSSADVIVEPQTDIFGLSINEYLNAKKIIAIGEEAMQAKIKELKKLIKN